MVGRARKLAGVVIALAALALGACTSSGSSGAPASTAASSSTQPATTAAAATAAVTTAATTAAATTALVPTTVAAPAGLAFYQPPDPLPSGKPGDIIWTRPLGPTPGGTAYLVLYLSQKVDGSPAAVSGIVAVPSKPAPAGGRVIVTWGHGTTGSADQCAPSRFGAASIPNLQKLLEAGYVVAATDYEGLGTPGPHPYLVGVSEGRGVLDAARAAHQFAPARASDRMLIYGHSQGGQAAVWAGQLAPRYAPDLKMLGVVAAAPAARLSVIYSAAASVPQFAGYVVVGADGMHAAYPSLPLNEVLSSAALAKNGIVEQACLDAVLTTYAALGAPVVSGNPLDLPDWGPKLKANDAGDTATPAPILLTQGDKDTTIPPALTVAYQQGACQHGSNVTLKMYPGQTHSGVIPASIDDTLAWMAARVAGTPAPSGCPAAN